MGNKGFTLIELAIVVGIIGILAAVTVPNFVDLHEKANADAVDSIQSQLELAIQEGVDRGYSVSHLRQYSGQAGSLSGITQNLITLPPSTSLVTGTTGQITVNFAQTNRSGIISIGTDGAVNLTSISGFQNHSIVNGRIE